MQHTPGPWVANNGDDEHPGMHPTIYGQHKCIADVGNAEDWVRAKPEWEANARLIAAAPDLLDACASVWAALSCSDDQDLLALAQECRAAIATATEQPTN